VSTQPLEAAIQSTRSVLAATSRDQLGHPTPCASWDVAGLVNHLIGAQHFFLSAMNGQAPAGDAPDFAAGDYLAAFDEASAACLAAFSAEGAMAKTVKLPFGEMPAAAVVGLAATDTFTHGWDLAKATGQSTDLAPELAVGLLAASKQAIQPGFRGEDGKAPFGVEQQAPAGATDADKLAAFLGRSV
jgi:uncharacterized protein (TIGR03086 family)